MTKENNFIEFNSIKLSNQSTNQPIFFTQFINPPIVTHLEMAEWETFLAAGC